MCSNSKESLPRKELTLGSSCPLMFLTSLIFPRQKRFPIVGDCSGRADSFCLDR